MYVHAVVILFKFFLQHFKFLPKKHINELIRLHFLIECFCMLDKFTKTITGSSPMEESLKERFELVYVLLLRAGWFVYYYIS